VSGKIEWSHETDLQEFYATQSLENPYLKTCFFEWGTFTIGIVPFHRSAAKHQKNVTK
jgi:hypothetical protein